MKIPEHLRYTEKHEWIDPATGKMGITDFAQDQLGDVVYLDFAQSAGDTVKAGDVLGTVESVKTVADIYAPTNGTVEACNDGILDQPEVVNQDPYGGGWMLQLKADDPSALDALLDAKAYRAHIGAEDE